MKKMTWSLLIAAAFLAFIAVSAMAGIRGRDSRYYHLLSMLVAPVSQRLHAGDAIPVSLPYEPALHEVPANADWRRVQVEQVDIDAIDRDPYLFSLSLIHI